MSQARHVLWGWVFPIVVLVGCSAAKSGDDVGGSAPPAADGSAGAADSGVPDGADAETGGQGGSAGTGGTGDASAGSAGSAGADMDGSADTDGSAGTGMPDGAPCSGVVVGAACWYLGSLGASCTDTCASHGGYDSATQRFAGSVGTDDQCKQVLDALGAGTAGDPVTDTNTGNALGCYYEGSQRFRELAGATTAGANRTTVQRACACVQ